MQECSNEPKRQETDYSQNPLAQKILKEGLAIQDRFSAEPIYAKTGKGYLKSVGVSEIEAAKKAMQQEALTAK